MGFLVSLSLVRRLKLGTSGSHWGLICSTWIWICRNATRRSQSCPLGTLPRTDIVNTANQQVARMVLLWLLLIAQQNTFCLEQPSSSLMCLHPRVLFVKSILGPLWVHAHTWMRCFGGPTPKATRLWSNNGYIRELHRVLPMAHRKTPEFKDDQKVANTHYLSDIRRLMGKTFVYGGSGLKSSQAYPEGYGEAHAKAFMRRTSEMHVTGEDPLQEYALSDCLDRDTWEDVGLREFIASLGLPFDRYLCHHGTVPA